MELFFFKSRWLKCGLFDNILLTLFTYTCTIKYMLICRGHQLLGDTCIQVSDKLSYIFETVLDLQLPMQSVLITTYVMSLNPAHGEM